ncbi:MAG: winged helix-turn-helix domain-containing protein [Candidatus Baldrarchaeia archaeon]
MYEPVEKNRQFTKKEGAIGFPLLKILERSFKILNMKNINVATIFWALTGLNYTAVTVLEMLLHDTLTVQEISKRIGKSRSWVQKLLTLLFKYELVERTWVSSQQKYFYRVSSKETFYNVLKSILDTVYAELIKFLPKTDKK